MKKIALAVLLVLAAFASGAGVEHAMTVPTCIVVHANGAPAPSSCSNPASYQVNG
jgi:hypothetical protein